MFDVDKEQIKRMAYFIYDWMRGIPVPTDIPVMAITYCMDALLKLLEKQEETNNRMYTGEQTEPAE